MRIIDVCAFYTPRGGGVRTYVHQKIAAAAAYGHQLIVLAPGRERQIAELPGGCVIATIPAPAFPPDRRYRYFADEAALHQALDAWRPDVVEVSSPWTSAGMVARWGGSAARSLIMHCDPLSAYAYRWFGGVASRPTIDRSFDWFWRHLQRLDRTFDTVVSASADLSERLRAGGLTKVVTLPMGVTPGLFSPTRRDERLRTQLLEGSGLADDATLLLGIGRYSPEKRWPMVIDAAVAAGRDRPIGLLLLGEGRSRTALTARVAGCPHVAIGPAIADRNRLATIIASADALVHGCEAETFCMVAAEAAASGLPIIAPDRGGAADHARSTGGHLYEAGNGRSLRTAITEFATHPLLPKHTPPDTRTMEAHFAELFAIYARRPSSPALAA